MIYASLADGGSSAYPHRPRVADEIQTYDDREALTLFFECYVAAGMANTSICKDKKNYAHWPV